MMKGWDEGQNTHSSIEVILPACQLDQMFYLPMSTFYTQKLGSIPSDVSGANYRDN